MKKTVKICIYNKSSSKNDVLLGNGDAILDNICLECKVHENLDGTYEIDAEFIIDNEGLWQHIEEEAILKVRLDYGYEYFRITKPRKTSNRIIVYGRQVTIYETMHLWLTDVRPENQDGAGALHWILDNATGIKELEVMSDIKTISTAYYMDMNMYEALHDCDQSFFNRWGGEIQRRGYTLRINQRIGTDRGVEIRSRKNLTGFEANTNIDNVVTRIKPKGFDGITIDGYVDSEYINKYPRIKTKEIKYEDVKLKDENNPDDGYETLAEAQAELTRLAKLEYTDNKIDVITAEYNISFVDLSKTEEYKEYVQAERVYLGDTVNVYEEKLDINVSVRAIDRVYDVLGERVEEIKLSNKDINKLHSINDILTDILKGVQENDNSLQLYIQNIINSGIQDSYVFYNKAELVICDSPEIENAINVWRFNRGGLAHSSNGYSGPYNVAITYDGKINADMILAGLIKGNYIDARNLTVTRTDGTKSLEITAGGDINLQPASMKVLIDDKVEFIGTQNQRNMALYGGQVCVFDSTNNNFLSALGAIIAKDYNIIGSGFILSKNCNHFIISRDSEWEDIYTNREPSPTTYFDIDFDEFKIKIGVQLLTGDINLQGNTLYDVNVGYIKDWYGFGWRLYDDGYQLMYANGHRIVINAPISFDGNELMAPNLYTDKFQFTNGHQVFIQNPDNPVGVANGSHWDWQGYDIINAVLRECNIVTTIEATSAQTYALRTMALNSEETYSDPTAKTITNVYGVQSLTNGDVRWADRQTYFTSEVEEGIYEAYVEIPWWLAQNIELDYHVNITPTNGFYQYYVSERDTYYFIVRSDKDSMGFTFELVATLLERNTINNNASVAGDQYLASDLKDPEAVNIITKQENIIGYGEQS